MIPLSSHENKENQIDVVKAELKKVSNWQLVQNKQQIIIQESQQ